MPPEGASWTTATALGNVPVRVRLVKIKNIFEHPKEPGVMLMDAVISRVEL